MRDPYAVLIARHWARDMAILETVLAMMCLFVLTSISWSKAPPWDKSSEPDDYLNDDDAVTVGGVRLNGQVHFNDSASWAMFAIIPWVHKGLLIFFDIFAVFCSCHGSWIAACGRHQVLCCDERGIFRVMGACMGASALFTAVGVLLTSLILLNKWRRALFTSDGEVKAILLFMTVYGVATIILLILRASAAVKAFTARTVLQEEVVTV